MVDAYYGEVRLFAGDFAPDDWMFCDGTELSMNLYPELFSLFGTTYGGDGVTTFALPNLNGRLPLGAGQGQGLSPYAPGQTGGSETVTLTQANMPSHSHVIQVSSDPVMTNTPVPQLTLATVDPGFHFYVDTSQGMVTGTTNFSPNALGGSGGSAPHDNVMPCVGLNYIICVQNGIYP